MAKSDLREAKIFSLAQVVDRCIVVIEELGGLGSSLSGLVFLKGEP